MVNNFNETILEAVQCNMDIKFIGSGTLAKAILYYITDYITKSQLKTHVAFAALKLAIRCLGEYDPHNDNQTIWAKCLLQKCACAMISHQELSAQQVCSYLMDYKDYFTSNSFNNLYWMSFESFIDKQDPSPKCTHHQRAQDGMTTTAKPTTDAEVWDRVEENDQPNLDQTVDDNGRPENSEEQHEDIEDEEVGISMDPSGRVYVREAQVLDYQLQCDELKGISVWDFVAWVQKTCIQKSRSQQKGTDESDEDEDKDKDFEVEEADDFNDAAIETDSDQFEKPNSTDQILKSHAHKLPTGTLLHPHVKKDTHTLKVCHPSDRKVPISISPAVPHRDCQEHVAVYSHLMLILFKPWHNASNPHNPGQTWQEAFIQFKEECLPQYLEIMINMQLLHKCKDSHNDHFAQHR